MKPSPLPQNLKSLRDHFNLSQVELADLVGATRGMIQTYERGEAVPKTKVSDGFKKVFGITGTELMKGRIDVTKLKMNAAERDYESEIAQLKAIIELKDLLLAEKERVILLLKGK